MLSDSTRYLSAFILHSSIYISTPPAIFLRSKGTLHKLQHLDASTESNGSIVEDSPSVTHKVDPASGQRSRSTKLRKADTIKAVKELNQQGSRSSGVQIATKVDSSVTLGYDGASVDLTEVGGV